MATAEPNLVDSEPTTKNNIQKVINNGTEYLIYGGGEGIKVFDVPAIGADITEQIDILTKGGAVMYRLNNHGAEDWHFNVVAFVKDARYIEIRSDMVSLFDESDTSAGYKDVGYIIYIYYNTSGVVNNVVTRYAGGLPTGGTAGQVLTKTAGGAEWQDASGGDVKIFYLSSNTDYTTATEALNWSLSGKMAIIRTTQGYDYIGYSPYQFVMFGEQSAGKYQRVNRLVLSASGGVVTQIKQEGLLFYHQQVVSALPSSPDAYTLYFITG